MRTILDIAKVVLQAARELARKKGTTAGAVLSDLGREGLRRRAGSRSRRRGDDFLGFRPFPGRGGVVTDELVNQLREAQLD